MQPPWSASVWPSSEVPEPYGMMGTLYLAQIVTMSWQGGRKGVSAWAVGCCLEEGALLEMFYLHFFGGLGEGNGVGHALCVVGCVLAVVLPLGSLDDEALCARRPKHTSHVSFQTPPSG